MKNLRRLLVITLMITAFSADAQFKFGLGGGVNCANISGDVSNNESLMGFNGGIMLEVKLPVKIGVEADVLYSVKGASFDYDFIAIDPNDPLIPKDGDLKLSYIDIPLVLKLYSLKVISFQLGGQYSMLVAASYDGEDVKESYKSGDISVVAGIGIDVLKFHASARYNFGLANIDAFGSKNNMLTLTVGLWLKK